MSLHLSVVVTYSKFYKAPECPEVMSMFGAKMLIF